MSSMPAHKPFWKDEPEIQTPQHTSFGALKWFFLVYRTLITFLILGSAFFVIYTLNPILGWSWLILITFLFGLGIYQRKRKKLSELNITQIQQSAREQTRASVIGSATHVAGHPLLEREQPVVLALASDGLKVFTYDDPHPVDTISLNQIVAFHTVVYDDERIPHMDVVDSSAQAFQITFNFQDREFTCLFRRMRKVRPIDWYHEFQKAQFRPIR